MNTRLHRVTEDQCCTGNCHQSDHCPLYRRLDYACSVKTGPRNGLWKKFCAWLNKLVGL